MNARRDERYRLLVVMLISHFPNSGGLGSKAEIERVPQFGKITAQEDTPMVAVHADDMKVRWGSVNAAAHRPVTVTVKEKTVQATVEDRIGVKGRIDLNPAAAKPLGLTPPFLVSCVWKWVDDEAG